MVRGRFSAWVVHPVVEAARPRPLGARGHSAFVCVCSMACGSPTVSRVVLAAGALREDRSALYPYMANHGASPHLLGGPPTNFLWRAFWVAPMGAPGRGYVGVPAFHIATNR